MSVAGKALVIGGATASGKSALALALARHGDVVVVNADSVQIYADLPTLTAQPGPDDRGAVPHRLYGVLGPKVEASAALWLRLVVPEIHAAWALDRLPVLVGGTGLYLHALLYGLAPVPEVPDDVRARVRATAPQDLHRQLQAEDFAMAARLAPNDTPRLMRALEVVRATGRSLGAWQADPPSPVLPGLRAFGLVLMPERTLLRERIHRRMALMMRSGAREEAAELRRRVGDPLGLPIGKAHGLREVLAVLDGEVDEHEAVARASVRIGQYAKRQATWFRHRFKEWPTLPVLGTDPAALDVALSGLSGGAGASGRGG